MISTMKRACPLCFLTVLLCGGWASAQDGVTVTGSIQSDILLPENDSKIGTEDYDEWALTNTYAEVTVQSKHFDGGARLEYLEHPLPGYETDFAGWGIPIFGQSTKKGDSTGDRLLKATLPYFFVKAHYDKWELTAGNFYEQFGSGFILRTYEERSLGIDNSLLGGRLVLRPFDGITLKALSGKQRRYWDYNDSWVSGADLELGLEQWIRPLQESGTFLSVGLSWVNKYEETEDIMTDATHKLNLPEYVNAFGARVNVQSHGFNILAEGAVKSDDPSFDNGYIYRKGHVEMLSASYSRSGLSVLLQAKRSDNMSMRSDRTMTGSSSYINNLPAFTMEHTYTLAALYPYATNADGEWAYQAELGYRFKKGTALGGKYGTGVKVNFSHVHAIDRREVDGGGAGTDGYTSSFFKWGDQTYYQDLNVQVEKRLSKSFNINLMYMNQQYNKMAVEGEGGYVHSDIFVVEGKYKISKRVTLRAEAQYLSTKDDEGDWMFALAELSVLPGWMFTISDEYNSGETDTHYYQGYVTYNTGGHRIQLGYGRTRAGYNCSGGVCRYVPATKGATLSYMYNF